MSQFRRKDAAALAAEAADDTEEAEELAYFVPGD